MAWLNNIIQVWVYLATLREVPSYNANLERTCYTWGPNQASTELLIYEMSCTVASEHSPWATHARHRSQQVEKKDIPLIWPSNPCGILPSPHCQQLTDLLKLAESTWCHLSYVYIHKMATLRNVRDCYTAFLSRNVWNTPHSLIFFFAKMEQSLLSIWNHNQVLFFLFLPGLYTKWDAAIFLDPSEPFFVFQFMQE